MYLRIFIPQKILLPKSRILKNQAFSNRSEFNRFKSEYAKRLHPQMYQDQYRSEGKSHPHKCAHSYSANTVQA